nr:hypothetical protein [Mucilaginibacter sp. L294]
MLNSYILIIKTEGGEREIFVSPFSLHSKWRPDIKPGEIEILYFYGQMQDDEYKAMLEYEDLDEKFKSERYIMNCGQDFEKHYIGCLHVDFDKKLYWDWKGKLDNNMSEQDVKFLAETLFNPESSSRPVMLFTPTRASDINLDRM